MNEGTTVSASLRYPDFICIGAQKAGTTWLHKRLTQHRDVWVPPLKEIHYFDVLYMKRLGDPDAALSPIDEGRMEAALRQARRVLDGTLPDMEKLRRLHGLSLVGLREMTDDWYGRIFADAPTESCCGEITPEYALLSDVAIRHMTRLKPGLKILFILRDPIARGWSGLRMVQEKSGRGEAANFHRMASSKEFLRRGDYMATIDQFRAHVPQKDFLVLYFDDIVERPEALLKEVCDFLGVAFKRAKFKHVDEPAYQGRAMTMPPDLYAELRENLRPAYERLLALGSPRVQAWYEKHYARAATDAA